MLSADELLAGGGLTFEIAVPAEVLRPGMDADTETNSRTVKLRPLTVQDLQLISRAAKEDDELVATLMVQRALVEPTLSVAEVSTMHVGLMQYLMSEVNRISGISMTSGELSEATEDPLVKAAFVLAREFGWTPEQINQLTLGQVLLHTEMLKQRT